MFSDRATAGPPTAMSRTAPGKCTRASMPSPWARAVRRGPLRSVAVHHQMNVVEVRAGERALQAIEPLLGVKSSPERNDGRAMCLVEAMADECPRSRLRLPVLSLGDHRGR